MRYIGNKTKLLPFIRNFLRGRRIARGRALDAFAGTAAVGSHLKSAGFDVVGCDIMTYSYVLQRAYVVADAYPTFDGLAGEITLDASTPASPLASVLRHLESAVPPRTSFITTHFSAPLDAPAESRMYFTRANAERIDAIRHTLHDWHVASRVTEHEYYILLATLIEAADAVANTAGVYAAFLKRWQPNARRPLRLTLPDLTVNSGRTCEAHKGDVNQLLDALGPFDLLYLDPPYNSRQYGGYYHVPELIARGWFADDPPALRGKTGLIDTTTQQSRWSVRDTCVAALDDLLTRANAAHVVLSYNNEGLIPEDDIARLFKDHGRPRTYRRVAQDYARYRADQRTYVADRTTEYLYYVKLR
ncbi:MAG TPA: DNA adenine methylase [Gemmatimonadaceae bacterium]|nr:DNA adenine methylase [Gemmatimonadaceae bacterium]